MQRLKKNFVFVFFVYKMVDISAKIFAENYIQTITQLRKDKKLAL